MLHAARPEDKDKDGRREGGAEEVVQRAHASPAAGRGNNRRTKVRRTVDKVDKPPAPTDLDLVGLPAGMCRRYQQGKCHKGRSCKWRHEYWSVLQQRWDAWAKARALALTLTLTLALRCCATRTYASCALSPLLTLTLT